MPSITELLSRLEKGEEAARDELFEHFYSELHQIAKRENRRHGADSMLQTTAIVNEACLKMADDNFAVSVSNRRELFGAANRAIKLILIDYARKRNSQKRTPQFGNVVSDFTAQVEASAGCDYEDLYAALDELQGSHPRIANVIEAKFFGRLTIAETAELLQISTDSVKRDWRFGKAFLYRILAK